MSTRVIAGSARGRKLKLVPGDSTRPIMDRVKEALFSILSRRIVDATVLDLFAGTGAVGIEALSRGASHATFVDMERRAIETIHDNLRTTGLAGRATVRRANAFDVLGGTPQPVDLIYIAPPQYHGLWLKSLELLDTAPDWLADDGIVVVQIDPAEQAKVALKHFAPYDERRYGSTLLWFFQRTFSEADLAREDTP
jgi:16S rRNA (guanine966-N2)-methyltransferase